MHGHRNRNVPKFFLVFNRPTLTCSTLERTRVAKPKYLFITVDRPREDHHGDAEAVEQARTVAGMVDWAREGEDLFREHNLGCTRAVSSAIDWALESVNELIVLDDDCLCYPAELAPQRYDLMSGSRA